MFKNAGIIFVLAMFIAGCSTSKPPEQVIKPVEINGEWSSLNWTNPAAISVYRPPLFKPVVPSNKPTAKPPGPAPVNTWTSLNQWAADHKLEPPHRLADLAAATYAIGSSNGVMVLSIGSLEAIWNGTEINLGFAPQFIDGELYLNGLDLQKNLKPLLCEPPLKFDGNRIIVIDPGHGGSNTGTHSVLDGRFEKEFTLDWAKRLKPLLETNGWTVFLTHTNDMDMSLADRVAFADSHHADFFISLHFNSSAPDQSQAGMETYCVTPTGMPSTLTRGFADPWNEVLPDNAFDAQNLQFAVRVQSVLTHTVRMADRGVRRARFIGVLRGENRPAILIEAGYLSNPAEAKLIESPEYRQKLAEALAAALK